MKNEQTVYIGIDLHSNTSTIGYMNEAGEYLGQQRVQTTPTNLINQVVAIPGHVKKLTLEQSNMAFWAADHLQHHVDELIVCDPRKNALISRGENKNDNSDTLGLCTLLRLDKLTEVWRPKQLGIRRLFFHQVKEYQRLVKSMSIHKRQLQSGLGHWGIRDKATKADYESPKNLLSCIGNPLLREEFAEKIEVIGYLNQRKERQLRRVIQTGKQFREIKEFLKIPGVGSVGSHAFSGYIQTPHRFRRPAQLIKFCKLAVRKFTSDGKQVRSERLSKAGHGQLKNLSHIAWKASRSSDNEVNRYYCDVLEESGNEVHARLTTQRKILITMWALWKNKEPYNPTKFTYIPCGDSTR
jgi:transposase